jgi:hypothetical protein
VNTNYKNLIFTINSITNMTTPSETSKFKIFKDPQSINRLSGCLEGKDGISGGLESADVWGDEADVSFKSYL